MNPTFKAVPADTARAATPVLLFDGSCGLCHGLVRALLRRDRRGRLKFAPLQGAPAQAYLRAQGLPTSDFDSLVFVPDWDEPAPRAYRLRTEGAIAALQAVGALRLALALRFVPAWIRDPAYRALASIRYAVFGQYRPRPQRDAQYADRFIG